MAQCSSKIKIAARRSGRRPKFHIFFIWVMLILTHLSFSSGHHHHHHHHHRSSSLPSSRKAMVFKKQFHAANVTVSSQPPVGKSANGDQEANNVFDEDKRIIHTGPNPLHN
ncbi:hypothetical protein SSX86_017557 [Deinandra increscens subsp. villosa]|uniref:Uncharacterized protein n=1 Tax=Deinandra increscens subsp. villosa TaxID=3103831 RepID=A0AAP0CVB7_9ASTR